MALNRTAGRGFHMGELAHPYGTDQMRLTSFNDYLVIIFH